MVVGYHVPLFINDKSGSKTALFEIPFRLFAEKSLKKFLHAIIFAKRLLLKMPKYPPSAFIRRDGTNIDDRRAGHFSQSAETFRHHLDVNGFGFRVRGQQSRYIFYPALIIFSAIREVRRRILASDCYKCEQKNYKDNFDRGAHIFFKGVHFIHKIIPFLSFSSNGQHSGIAGNG
jgi:hypothetical protein